MRRAAGGARPAVRLLFGLVLLTGCDGPQSALDTAGRDADRIAGLFWAMVLGALLIWAAVVGLSVYAIRGRRQHRSEQVVRWLIVGGGAVFPTVTLFVLLGFGLAALPDVLALPPPGGMRIEVIGEQWWWRVRYVLPDGRRIELANEIRLPIGERVECVLESADVIHSFWVPALSGKVDMTPGRVTRIALEPTREGRFRGVCAEYCGASHALMSFWVVVTDREAFDAWLEAEAGPATPPEGAVAQRGAELFLATGCGACHTVRGTAADGRIGPDLTHVGRRISLGAGILGNDVAAFRAFLERTDALKPEVHMPTFDMLPEDELLALATYLKALR